MKRYSARILLGLVTLTLGIAVGTFWIKRRTVRQPLSTIPAVVLLPYERERLARESVIEIVFRDMIQSHEAQTTYFLSFGPDNDPADSFMARFKGSSVVIRKLSEALRNGPQVIDRESGTPECSSNLGFVHL